MGRHKKRALALLAVGFVVVTAGSVSQGHEEIASRWNYNEHLFPIFRDRCGACHIEGGIAPMSLLVYESAYPWTQSIREEVLGLRMPPWQAEDGFGDFRNGHALPAHELDMILGWSSGGYPRGPRDQTPEVPAVREGWRLGEPDLTLRLQEPFSLDAGTTEVVRYFVLPAQGPDQLTIRAVAFQPDARAVVRGAAVFVDASGRARELDAADAGPGFAHADDYPATPPVGVWMPGEAPVMHDGAGYRLPAGADVVLRIHYKKTWMTEGTAFTDQSRLGLYFTDDDAAQIESLVVTSLAEVSGTEVTFRHTLEQESTVLALFPEVNIESSELQVEAVKPDGSRVPMLWLREPDSGWPIRFWFETPVTLPAGSHIEATAVLDPAAARISRASLLGNGTAPLRFSIDYVPGALSSN